jgi:putative ubiquitin-RnfH superfamily antitoxin RatB of RatAB toxin-antitoxin module
MAAMLRIEVVYALPARCWSVRVDLPPGASVAEALTAAAMDTKVPGLVVDGARLAVFGRSVVPASLLHDGDRIEILRPLLADPKQARRKRAEDAAKLSRR